MRTVWSIRDATFCALSLTLAACDDSSTEIGTTQPGRSSGGDLGSAGAGMMSTGGRSGSTGGAPFATGGTSTATGGSSTGGSPVVTGGAGGLQVSTGGAAGAGGTLPKSFPCNNPTPVSGGYVRCDGDWRHRPVKEACPPRLPRPDPTCMFGYAGSCAKDSDCTARPDGFCPGGINAPCECQYPCHRDEECQTGEICECSSGICMPATCTTDADCDGALCAQYWLTNVCTWGFACQTPLDECASQNDCGQQQQCSLVDGHRACTQFCPPPPP